jgi:hypothetical protein
MWLFTWHDNRTPRQQEQDRDQIRSRRPADSPADPGNDRRNSGGRQIDGDERPDGGRQNSL